MLFGSPSPQIKYFNGILLGSDPEFFFKSSKGIVAADKVIGSKHWEDVKGRISDVPPFVIDGIQAEFHPATYLCRAQMGSHFHSKFLALQPFLPKGITPILDSVVELGEEEFESLTEDQKRLGCAPSLNYYNSEASIDPSAQNSRIRAAGGHIHIGLPRSASHNYQPYSIEPSLRPAPIYTDRIELIPLMDSIVGNTCVLIDKGEHGRIRRQTYGRAGEYRLPDHGIEYRVLSNFWLRSYSLMSMVMGLTKFVVSMKESSYPQFQQRSNPDLLVKYQEGVGEFYVSKSTGKRINLTEVPYYIYEPLPLRDWASEWLSEVDLNLVQTAINENDPVLARITFDQLCKFVTKNHISSGAGSDGSVSHCFAIGEDLIKEWQYFLSKPVTEWFPAPEFLSHWGNGTNYGWERFLKGVVGLELAKKGKKNG